MQAQLLRGMWDLPGPGIEPMSPALTGGFLTAMPPGKSSLWFLDLYGDLSLSIHFKSVFIFTTVTIAF